MRNVRFISAAHFLGKAWHNAIKKAIASIFLVALAWPGYTKEAEILQVLTLDQTLALSVQSHPLILAKKQEFQAAEGDLSAARWALFPNAGFSVRGFRKDGDQEALDQEVLSVSQPIWTGGKITGAIGVAKAKRDAAKLAVIETEQAVLVDTARSFIDMHRAKLKVDISLSNVEEHERLYKIIERRVGAATSPQVDLRLANARLAFSKSQLLQNSNALDVAKADLEQLIGRPIYDITAPQAADMSQFSLGEAENAALSFSPAIRKMRSEIAGLKSEEKVAKSALYPQISLGYEKRYGDLAIDQEDEQVFLGLDFQPGAGLSTRSSIRVSQAKKGALNETLRALERETRRQVKITWREYSAARLQLSPTQLLVDSTSQVVGSYLRQYTVGRKSWLDVLNAQRELVQAQYALTDHQAIQTLASFKLKIFVGELNSGTVGSDSE